LARLIIGLYRLLMMVLVLPACLILRNKPNFKGTLLARCGFRLPQVPGDRPVIWVHAASVGEVRAIAGLVAAIKASRPDLWVVMTCMTVTGREVAATVGAVDQVAALPFDLRLVMRRFVARLRPQLIMIAETEIWPELLLTAAASAVPVLFANARMTAKSFDSYARFKRLFGTILAKARVLAIAPEDAARFRDLGAAKVEVLGNLKLDSLKDIDEQRRERLRRELVRPGARVFVAGSVREGEDGYVVIAIARARTAVPELLAIVAPRHTQSIALVQDLCERAGLRHCLRSGVDLSADVIIVDTVGELASLYGLADAAFVGGSLVELGGQNILEAVAWGVPVMHGASMQNFEWALEVVRPHTLTVSSEFAQDLVGVLKAPDEYAGLAAAARQALLEARGATERYLVVVLEYL